MLMEGTFCKLEAEEKEESVELQADVIRYEANGEKVFAEGNAQIRRGDTTLRADLLIGFLSNSPPNTAQTSEKGMGLGKIEAYGHVVYESSKETARGDEGSYDLAQESLRLKGTPAQVIMGDIELGASVINFQKRDLRLEALDRVVLTQPDQVLRTKHLIAYFKEAATFDDSRKKRLRSSRLTFSSGLAQGFVQVDTSQYRATAFSAKFQDGEFTFTGGVKISQGAQLVTGECGWYQTKEKRGGVRRCESKNTLVNRSPSRVRALFYATNSRQKGKVTHE